MGTENIVNLILSFCFAIPIALVITPIFVYLKKVMYHPFLKKKLLDSAIKNSHVVKAKLIKEHDINNYAVSGVHPTGEKMAIYEYSYNGKTYKKQFISHNNFNNEMTLYFIKSPRKAAVSRELWVTAKNHWIRSFFIIMLLATIILWIIITLKFIQWG